MSNRDEAAPEKSADKLPEMYQPQPAQVDRADLLEYKLALAEAKSAEASMQLARIKVEQVAKSLQAKYEITENDKVDDNTGRITRQ